MRLVICTHVLLLFLSPVVMAGEAGADDEQVVEFFRSVEESFKNMHITEIMSHIHRDFSYNMNYSTDGIPSVLESDSEKYRRSLGSFFKSKPDIYEYSIEVEEIQRTEENIKVLARIISVVQLNGIINSCDAMSSYTIAYVDDGFQIKGVQGDATCTNKRVN